ncbi:MAG TPA: cation transporting ATPase C-terminal domain-containing protein, partial [Spirochaetia bacterium]|nr:cation transporting ATPase C-terminal domain-containing protein [Spirochaetia bacterium]
ADIVLTDNNFSSIVSAIEEGRTQFRNVRRTSFFLISTNVAESLTLLTFLILGLPLPLLAIHILWLNIITGGVTDVALATEKVHDDILSEPPRKREEPVLNRYALYFIITITVSMVALGLVSFLAFGQDNEIKGRTALFVFLSLSQLWCLLSMRSLKKPTIHLGLFTNKNINLAIIASILLLLGILYIPILQTFFSFTHLAIADLGLLFLASFIVFLVAEATKLSRYHSNYNH